MRLVVDLTLPVETRLMAQTRRVVQGYLEGFGVDGDDVSDVVLAVAEACSNVVRHSSLDHTDCYRLSAEIDDDVVLVVVEDRGSGIAGGRTSEAADGPATSGRGLDIMRALMTSVDVQTAPDRQGTRVQMRKDLKLHAAGLSAEG